MSCIVYPFASEDTGHILRVTSYLLYLSLDRIDPSKTVLTTERAIHHSLLLQARQLAE